MSPIKSLSTAENKQRAKKQERLTIEQFRELAEKISPTKSLCSTKNPANGKKTSSVKTLGAYKNKLRPKNKYHAQKYNGYDSKKEYYRSEQLKL